MEKELSNIIQIAVGLLAIFSVFASLGFFMGKMYSNYEHMKELKREQESSLESKIVSTEIMAEEATINLRNNKTINDFLRDRCNEEEKKIHDANLKCTNIVDYREPYFFKEKTTKEKESKKMIDLCKKAVSLDEKNSTNIFYLAIAYHKNKDYEKVVELLEKSSNLGNNIAQRKLGIMYLTGNIVEKNTEKYVHYFNLASKNGDKASKIIIYNEYYK